MAETGNLNPQLQGGSDLETLINSAIRQIGEYSPESVNEDTVLAFQEYANRVIDEINKHPYRRGKEEIRYYVSATERRQIHDNIIITGLIYYYSMRQGESAKMMASLHADFRNTLNSQLWYDINGNRQVRMKITDGGTQPYNNAPRELEGYDGP